MIDMKLNNDVSLAKNNNNSLAGWAGHCAAILSGIDNQGGTGYLLCSAMLYHHCQLFQCYWFQQIISKNMDA